MPKLNSTDFRFVKKWQKSRKKGIVKHSILIGSLWGIGCTLIHIIVKIFSHTGFNFLSSEIYVRMSLYIIGGILLVSWSCVMVLERITIQKNKV